LFGDRARSESGQLALMDALVFFLVAVTISSVILYYSAPGESHDAPDHGQGQGDPHEVLETILHSSIGSEIVVLTDVPRHISSDTDVSQCLLLEAEAVLDGMSIDAFGPLNDAVKAILESVCSPMYESMLRVYSSSDAGLSPIVSIPDVGLDSSQQYGASMELTHDEEKDLHVQLILSPAAFSEVVDVMVSELHLSSSVLSSPPELQP
jgi:hypothetical protein